ncbi:MAG: ferrous iron transport protein B [Planctomycetes bacterium]|nr:ferrous iron transport protein B [Planctomycetota bacterium]
MMAVRNPTIALVGNPNTGKTTLFNALAGMNQRVGNYPGVTVETKKGKLHIADRTLDLIDLPGTYSLAPRSPDEMVAVDVILGNNPSEPRPDVVVTIVDASNLERNLYLMTQVLELGVPVIIALNMVDVARSQGLKIDVDRLSQQLGVPIVPIQANRGVGLDALKSAIARVLESPACGRCPAFPDAFEHEVATLQACTGPTEPVYLIRRLVLDVGGYAEKRLGAKYGADLIDKMHAARQRLVQAGFTLAGIEARIRYAWIRKMTAGCIERPVERVVSWTDRLDKVLTHRILGTLIFLAVMFLVFETIFVVADPFMGWIKLGVGWIEETVASAMAAGPLRSLLVEGVIRGVGAVVVFIPQIVFLFAIIAVLEDCGYMARAAFLMDRLMARAGLNGKSFIPLLSSMACAVPGIMSARVIENPRDRLATILVAPLMSCSARLPVYSLLVAAFLPIEEYGWFVPGLVFFSLYLIGIILAPALAFVLKSTLLRGETPVFVMEMPLYKMPSAYTVLRRSFDAGRMFLKRAGTMILASMILVWAALYFPSGDFASRIETATQRLEGQRDELDEESIAAQEKKINELRSEWKAQSLLGQVGKWIEPAVEPLGWDWRIGMAALASFPAREVMVGTLGIIFGEGEGDAGEEEYRRTLGGALREARRPDGRAVFSVPVALSVLVFFALCCQCVSTLVVIKRETNTWRWPIFTFVYMTALAYVGAFLTYQIGCLF